MNFLELKGRTEDQSTVYVVTHDNGTPVGELYQEVDGYYVFHPIHRQGYWDEMSLRQIVDKMQELNAPWDAQVQADLSRLEEVHVEIPETQQPPTPPSAT